MNIMNHRHPPRSNARTNFVAHRGFLASITLAAVSVGCSHLETKRVLASSDTVHGVRVQVPERHRVIVAVREGEDIAVKGTEVWIASRDEHYDIDFCGGLFSSADLSVSLHPNGAVKEFGFNAASKLGEAGSALGTSSASVATAVADAKKAVQPAAASNPVDTENADLKRSVLNLMLKANKAALDQGLTLPYPDVIVPKE